MLHRKWPFGKKVKYQKASTTNLVISCDVLRRTPVNDAADGGLVDAHAKGDCGYDHRDLAVHEILLN